MTKKSKNCILRVELPIYIYIYIDIDIDRYIDR